MKTKVLQTIGLMLVLLLLSGSTPLWSQYSTDFYTVRGVVKDKHTLRSIDNANIAIKGTNEGTVTNADGEFAIKIKDRYNAKALEISCIGYSSVTFPVNGEDMKDVKIYMQPTQNLLDPITIYAMDAGLLVKNAIKKIGVNYSTQPNLLSGFYRETIKKKRSYVNVSEAIIEIYKTSYSLGADRDLTEIYKGRKLVSTDPSDTILVKLLGGPNLSLYIDIVKNSDLIFNTESLSFYKFKMEGSAMIDERPNYVVSFEPQVVRPYALYFGKLYIDVNTLAFTRAEFSLSMDDRNKVTQEILKKKPLSLHFKPEEVSFLVTYKQRDGITSLNYIRSEVKFKCDWKKRLFSTNYAVVSETVVTGGKETNAERIPYKQAFKDTQSLTDRVNSFSDPAFWEDYNIIEPDQSLENAVNKLKKEQSR